MPAPRDVRVIRLGRQLVRNYLAHGGSDLSALLTYYGFLAVFPMLLAAVTVLGLVLRNHPGLQDSVLSSSVAQFPVLGAELRANVRGLPGISGLVTGLVVGLLGARAFCLVLQRTVEVVWAVPLELRPRWLSRQLRTLGLVGIVGLGAVGSSALTALATTSGLRLLLLILVLPGTAGLLLMVLRITAPDVVATRDLLVASVVAAVGLITLQVVGTRVVVHLTTSREVYGAFATVLGLLAWLYLQSQVLVTALEIGQISGTSTSAVSSSGARVRRLTRHPRREAIVKDTANSVAEEVKGHTKRVAGKLLDDDELEQEGSAQAEKGREQRRAETHETKAEMAEARHRLHQQLK
jgi:uncharacterized BrkB/YihY/UPF0761 family membrane protein/uncharacterized protein YjbJ (UPF0337 family)